MLKDGIVTSCTKDFDELNTNPNLITEKVVKIDGLFTQVVANSVSGIFGGRVGEFVNFTNPGDGFRIYSRFDYEGSFNGYYTYLININEIFD
jgi:hypothetical protein